MKLTATLRTSTLRHASTRRMQPSAMVARLERYKDELPPRLNVG
ncbi:hypothetical protein [Dactylosporangium sp. NPDC049140]